jgi:hypothetical protein
VVHQFQRLLQDAPALLGGPAEQRRVGVLAIQVQQDGHRLVQREVAVLDRRHLAARVDGQVFG